MSLEALAPFDDDGLLLAVVESPRGARVKFEYDSQRGAFKIHRPLPLGLAYPLDWGFVPGTAAGDGDPIDVFVMGEQVSYPGTLILARVLAALDVRESKGKGKAVSNPRIVAAPEWLDAKLCRSLLDECRADLEAFLVTVGQAAGKKIHDTTWLSARKATHYIETHRR